MERTGPHGLGHERSPFRCAMGRVARPHFAWLARNPANRRSELVFPGGNAGVDCGGSTASVAGANLSDIMTRRANGTVALFGAYGHTGRFVGAELLRRGITAILSGRDRVKLEALGRVHPNSDLRVASIEDPASLDRALDDAEIVINCAGPF